MSSDSAILMAALEYCADGYTVIPVPYRQKAPLIKGWSERTIKDFDESEYCNQTNIGIVLGDASNGLVDIDLDCPEALAIAHRFLPSTGRIFGRKSKPKSHWLYQVENCGKSKKYEYEGTLVEYRANGAQTVFPPSTNPTGEVIQFDVKDELSLVATEELLSSAGRLAAACLLAKHWHEGQRHQPALALAGSLLNAGWTVEETKHFIASICIAAGDDDIADKMKAVDTTYQNKLEGQPIAGTPKLAELLDTKIVSKMREWLGISNELVPVRTQLPALVAVKGIEETFTDSALSDVFVSQCKEKACFCPDYNKWMVWDKKRWCIDDRRAVTLLIENLNRQAFRDFLTVARPYEIQNAAKCLHSGRINSIADLSKGKMIVQKKELDADLWLFNCNNGVLNLRTGQLLPHDPSLKLSYISPVDYDPKAQCPKFLEFLDQIMMNRKGLVDFLQRAAGYSLTGNTREHCFFILNGNGRNGKSTFVDVLRYIMGDYAGSLHSQSLLAQKYDGIPNDLAALSGRRFVCASEINENKRLDEAKIKMMTGGEPVNARFLNQEWFSYTPQFKIWLSTNVLPEINERNEGIWSRIHCIPFDRFFSPEERDMDLKEKLIAEAPGILNWMLHGCLEWQSTGLKPPAEVLASTQRYREDMDYLSAFFAEHIIIEPQGEVTKAALYEEFSKWYDSSWPGDSVMPKKNGFGRLIGKRNIEECRDTKGNKCWKGIRLKGPALH